MLNFYPPFLCRVLAAILKMADSLKIYVSIIIHLEIIRKFFTGRHFQNGRHNTAQIQHCPISTKFHI
jgi:hypothetical protein